METMKRAWQSTRGYKTASGGVLLMVFQLIKMIWGTEIPPEWQEWILNAISVIAATGVFDKLWRSRKEIIQWIKRMFNGKKEASKEKEMLNEAP